MGENIKCKKIGNTGKKLKLLIFLLQILKIVMIFKKVQNRTEKIQKTTKQKLQ